MNSSPIVLFILLFLLHPPTVDSMDRPWSARHRGLSGARCILSADLASVAVNPAGMAGLESFSASVSFTPGIFGLPELQTHSVLVGTPVSFGGIGLGVSSFGFELYRETCVILGGGIIMNKDLALGLSTEFRRYTIKGYGAQTLVLLNVSVLQKFHDLLTISGTIENGLNASLGNKEDRLPRAISLGVVFTLDPAFLAVCEVEKDSRDAAFLKAAIEFRPVPSVALRSGFSSDPITWSFGCTISAGFLSFGYGGTSHVVLGWTHQWDVDVRWPE
ncbi:MAG: hypothetical protein WEB33_06550 [Bacteroidota bacterium]